MKEDEREVLLTSISGNSDYARWSKELDNAERAVAGAVAENEESLRHFVEKPARSEYERDAQSGVREILDALKHWNEVTNKFLDSIPVVDSNAS